MDILVYVYVNDIYWYKRSLDLMCWLMSKLNYEWERL